MPPRRRPLWRRPAPRPPRRRRRRRRSRRSSAPAPSCASPPASRAARPPPAIDRRRPAGIVYPPGGPPMNDTAAVERAYGWARERYAHLGVSTDRALEILTTIPISLHCWQGDDVGGFEN